MRSKSLAFTRPLQGLSWLVSLCPQTYFPATLPTCRHTTHFPHFYALADLNTTIHYSPALHLFSSQETQLRFCPFPKTSLDFSQFKKMWPYKFPIPTSVMVLITECSVTHTRLSNLRAEAQIVYGQHRVSAVLTECLLNKLTDEQCSFK